MALDKSMHTGIVEQRLHALQQRGTAQLLANGRKGLEKESLRVSPRARISRRDHPVGLGSALTHPYITTDYSEALPEFVTPSFANVADTVQFLNDLHIFAHRQLQDETLWAASMPCIIDADSDIRIAEYGTSNIGRLKHIYRVGLEYRYGRRMQAIAGVHFNYSLNTDFWPAYRELLGYSGEPRGFQDASYFGLVRNVKRFAWLVLYLCGNSPALSHSFLPAHAPRYQRLDEQTLYLPYATSLRMSDIGYKNKNQAALHISYDRLEDYVRDLGQAIATPLPEYEVMGIKRDDRYIQLNTNVLQIENEFYSVVRPKRTTYSGEKPSVALRERGVEYIEMRALDLQTEFATSIDPQQLRFMEALLIYCLLENSPPISEREADAISYNELTVALRGRQPGLPLVYGGGHRNLRDWAREICQHMSGICEVLDGEDPARPYQSALAAQLACIEAPETLPSARLLQSLRSEQLPFSDYIMQRSLAHQKALLQQRLPTERALEFQRVATDSVTEQRALEQAPAPPFDEFLRSYFGGS